MEESQELVPNVAANAEVPEDSSKKDSTKRKRELDKFQIVVAVLLAITALTTAWASWIGELHNSDQASNYALADRQSSEATAQHDAENQLYVSAYEAWNYAFETNETIKYEIELGDTSAAAHTQQVLDAYLNVNCKDYPEFKTAIYEALAKGGGASPFDTYSEDSFYQKSNEMFEEASQTREAGNWNNLCSDSYGLVRVLYSIVLFLLGIINIYREPYARNIILVASQIMFVGASIYMATLPLPVDFDFIHYFTVTQR